MVSSEYVSDVFGQVLILPGVWKWGWMGVCVLAVMVCVFISVTAKRNTLSVFVALGVSIVMTAGAIFLGSFQPGFTREEVVDHLSETAPGVVLIGDASVVTDQQLSLGVNVETDAGVTLRYESQDGVESFWRGEKEVNVNAYCLLDEESLVAQVEERTALRVVAVPDAGDPWTPALAAEAGGISVLGMLDNEPVMVRVVVDANGQVLDVIQSKDSLLEK